jgi:hypothetical protein
MILVNTRQSDDEKRAMIVLQQPKTGNASSAGSHTNNPLSSDDYSELDQNAVRYLRHLADGSDEIRQRKILEVSLPRAQFHRDDAIRNRIRVQKELTGKINLFYQH